MSLDASRISLAVGTFLLATFFKLGMDQAQPPTEPAPIVVVGGGLAGAVAALTAGLGGRPVLLLEKEPQPGGNSQKASSGLSTLTPELGDSAELFTRDILESGQGQCREDLVKTLVGKSGEGLQLLTALGVDLSGVVQLGGHSVKRTHFNQAGPNVGFAIMRAVLEAARQAPSVRVVSGARVTELTIDSGGRVSGVAFQADGDVAPQQVAAAGVILATGGFEANQDMLRRLAPDVADLATTSGPWAQGDGIALAEQVGAELLGLSQVQIHPTGFVDPADPGSRSKILAPEKLRGVGGILVNRAGHRFVDELATRDRVSQAIMQQPFKRAHLLLGRDSTEQFGPQMKFYEQRGLARAAETLEGLAALLRVPAESLRSELEAYNGAVAAGVDRQTGKSVFPAAITPPYLVAHVEPVVHYCMGGVAINADAQVLDRQGRPIPGLFAAGEVTGGVHGANRLGGTSLAECIVYGRLAGQRALQFVT